MTTKRIGLALGFALGVLPVASACRAIVSIQEVDYVDGGFQMGQGDVDAADAEPVIDSGLDAAALPRIAPEQCKLTYSTDYASCVGCCEVAVYPAPADGGSAFQVFPDFALATRTDQCMCRDRNGCFFACGSTATCETNIPSPLCANCVAELIGNGDVGCDPVLTECNADTSAACHPAAQCIEGCKSAQSH